MTYGEPSADCKSGHALALDNRARLDISGVTDVRGFNDTVILLTTVAGDMTVRGESLHIDTLDLVSGELKVSGCVSDIGYSEPPVTRGLWKRLFG